MKKFVVFAILAAIAFGEEIAVSSKMIREINSMQNSWKAGHNHVTRMPKSRARHLLSIDMEKIMSGEYEKKVFTPEQLINAPETFDSRTQWPNCTTIQEIRDQKECESCWAFGAVETISDRQCIHKHEIRRFSAEDMASCGKGALGTCGNCEKGGEPECAWWYYTHHGVVSEDCYPYSAGNDTSYTPACVHNCTGNPKLDWDADKRKGKKHYIMVGESQMMSEVSENGPIEAVMFVYTDFLSYESGIYHHVTGSYEGGHAVKLIGYGEENGEKYWICANSWDVTWGEKGFFRIRRGHNDCMMEIISWAGLPE